MCPCFIESNEALKGNKVGNTISKSFIENQHKPNEEIGKKEEKNTKVDIINEDCESSLEEKFYASDNNKNFQFKSQISLPKWPNRVFAIQLIRQFVIIQQKILS